MTKPVQMLFLILLNIFFEKNIKSNLALVNFLALLRDGSTDKSITEQEVVYVIFTDPETHLPVLKFFHIIVPSVSQDAPGLKQAITDSFNENSLESALGKMVLFQKDYPWIYFIWCFSHRLELALKDALKEYMEAVYTMLTNLYYLYTKPSKKHHKLKN